MRLIDADNIQGKLATLSFYTDGTFEGKIVEYVRGLIDAQPTIDAVPVAHAHWIPEYPNKRTGKAYWHKCSECGRSVFDNRQVSIDEMGYAFCPHCGAKMDEELGL